ncbi:hypothetical protein GRI75_10760 [Altererythrobacter soli]|uniref:Uncharacterized protein n=1 Tax=Croceibacterium soli TaxID=1739690 RepID=A0A6I4UT82_9SPHN|nr:hypothetical protein [Croceibacterium soli]MXP42120.1 hypothetical protein [Croceibacterium soli]
MATQLDPIQDFDLQDGWRLPAWTDCGAEFFELEKKRVFARAWQVGVCHESTLCPRDVNWKNTAGWSRR